MQQTLNKRHLVFLIRISLIFCTKIGGNALFVQPGAEKGTEVLMTFLLDGGAEVVVAVLMEAESGKHVGDGVMEVVTSAAIFEGE